ncbi:hypothetical protein BT63DRAFT_423173 [Microthyrium microscopicum]|uniref:RED-like N-terminal domain-containing protein n=1 Tax=Microthyrium microscopicum TaxID=703497 RepID=A0A6A6UHH8_9PEZI|nr:hypothetical protein BT63DRAFT_423173 [Microthyrium microscopicum]
MNNDQFRRLIASNSSKVASDSSPKDATSTTKHGSRSTALMTPRTVKNSAGADYAQQFANSHPSQRPSKNSKNFKSIAPKGVKLAKGYQDRTHSRVDDEDDEAGKQIKELEKSLKEGEIDLATFEQRRDAITGGDLEKTHLVKGLDWKLLARIKKGEDPTAAPTEEAVGDIDDEFEQLEQHEVVAAQKEAKVKQGQKADPGRSAGTKRTRDEILAELKASRKRAAEAAQPAQSQLGTKFRRVGEPKESTRLEVDNMGREVLIITDAKGNVKRKVRKTKEEDKPELEMPDKDAVVLGADVSIPDFPEPEKGEESEGDIYADVGDDYDPLAGLAGSDSDSEDSDKDEPKKKETSKDPTSDTELEAAISEKRPQGDSTLQPESKESTAIKEPPEKRRNYFNDGPSSLSVLDKITNPLHDPAVFAALAQKAKGSEAAEKPLTEEEQRLKKRAEMLAGRDRDLDDMDMGFGGSRFDDADEMAMEDSNVKLAEWQGGDGDDDDGEQKGKGKRKRGAKKRKGDKNSAADVLKVIESRK